MGDPLHPDGPNRVLDPQQPCVDRLDRVAHQWHGARVDPPLELLDPALEALGPALEIRCDLGLLKQALQAGDATRAQVDGHQVGQGALEAVGEGIAGLVGPEGGRDTALHSRGEFSWFWWRSIRRPA